jgi:hypothetical protein
MNKRYHKGLDWTKKSHLLHRALHIGVLNNGVPAGFSLGGMHLCHPR